MQLKGKSAIIILTFIWLLTLASCHSKRVATTYSEQNDSWTTLYATVDVDMSKPMEMGCSSRLTMENGKCIHLSMRFIGMEVASLYMNSDSIYFVDKYHKYLFAEPLDVVLGDNYRHLTISDLQRIFLGQKTIAETENVVINPDNFVETPAGPVASDLSVFADTEQGIIKGSVNWKPSSAKWNEDNRTVSFKAPTNYKRITLQNLRSVLKSLSF